MYADQIDIGQFFTVQGDTLTNGDVLQCIPANLGTDGWQRYPGILCVNTKTGAFVGLGGAQSVDLTERPANPRREMIMADVVKLVERQYEFGIGSAADEDPYYAATQYKPTGETRQKLIGRGPARGPMPDGCRYDEDCDICHHTTVVCNNCGCCERHCHCGD